MARLSARARGVQPPGPGRDGDRLPADLEYYPYREFVEAALAEPCYHGPSGYRGYVEATYDVWGTGVRLEPTELIDLGDRLVVLADMPMHAQASGIALAETYGAVDGQGREGDPPRGLLGSGRGAPSGRARGVGVADGDAADRPSVDAFRLGYPEPSNDRAQDLLRRQRSSARASASPASFERREAAHRACRAAARNVAAHTCERPRRPPCRRGQTRPIASFGGELRGCRDRRVSLFH